MTIAWPSSSTNVCDGSDRALGKATGPANLAIDLAPGLIVRNFAGGEGPAMEETGNDPVTVSFSVFIRKATHAEAAAVAAALVLTTKVGELALSSGLTLKDAGLTGLSVRQFGAGVRADYRFMGRVEAAS
jgi:hypothetical protein